MKISSTLTLIISLAAILAIAACTRDSDIPGLTLGTGGVTASQLSNNYSICHIVATNEFGTNLNGMSFFRAIHFQPDSTYLLNVDLYTGTSCQTGGNEVFSYSQTGTYATGGVLTSPAGATQVVFTVKTSTLTNFGGAPPGNTWANYFNLYCPGSSLGLSTNSTSVVQVSAAHCLHDTNPNFSFPTFTASGATLYDAIILNAGTVPVTITTSPIVSIFEQGMGGNYPTASTLIYTAF